MFRSPFAWGFAGRTLECDRHVFRVRVTRAFGHLGDRRFRLREERPHPFHSDALNELTWGASEHRTETPFESGAGHRHRPQYISHVDAATDFPANESHRRLCHPLLAPAESSVFISTMKLVR